MSLPLLEQFEAQRTASRERMETERVMRANGHTQAEIEQTLAAGPQSRPYQQLPPEARWAILIAIGITYGVLRWQDRAQEARERAR